MASPIEQAIRPTTPMGRRALGYANSPRSRAMRYFAKLMASPLTYEMCKATRVVRLLQGDTVHTFDDLTWLNVLTSSDDPERRQMATLALGVILEGR